MILEGIVTTIDSAGTVNVAPMGPEVDPDSAADDLATFVLKPYPSSRTYANLRQVGCGVLHVTDDVLLLARAAVGAVDPPLVPADSVPGWRLADCCRFYEFEITDRDERLERIRLGSRVTRSGRVRDFFGFNRGKHAVLEAAILASRVALLPHERIGAEFERLRIPVEKTGGPREREAFDLLCAYVRRVSDRRPDRLGVEPDDSPFRPETAMSKPDPESRR